MPTRADDATLQRLLSLLPVHHVARDVLGDGTPGPLTALLEAVARELEVLEDDVDRLYDGWFIETCEEWLVPYLAELVGLHEVPPDLGTTVSRRALVANTVAYRRRKGTLAAVEQVARDVTGWPTRAVEYHPLLVATAHVNHVRLDRLAVSSLRGDDVERGLVVSPPSARASLDPLAHTVEVRRTTSRRGRYGIRSIGVFGFSTSVVVIGTPPDPSADPPTGPMGGWSRTRAAGGWHHVDPLARSMPLFVPPAREESIESLADEADLPVPLRPRRLLALLRGVRAGSLDAAALPIGVRVGASGTDLPPERIRVCGLEDLAPGPEPQVMVDAVAGRLRAFRDAGSGVAPYVPTTVFVRYAYGVPADVGAGPWDRAERHDDLLACDTWTPPVSVPGDAVPLDRQVQVSSAAAPGTPDTVAGLTAALADAESAWAAGDTTHPDGTTTTALGATTTVSVADSARYPGDLDVAVPAGTRLVLVAARWPSRTLPDGRVEPAVPGRYAPDGLRPHVGGSLRVTGAPGASVVVDGLLVQGDLVVSAGDLGSLTLAHCTVTGRVLVESDAAGASSTLTLRLARCVVAGIDTGTAGAAVTVVESILDPQGLPAGTPALVAATAHASLEGCTVRGGVRVRSLEATSSLLDGPVDVAHRQVGCVRFSYVAPGSRTPRRYRCVPVDAGAATPRPVYVSTDPASPAYLVLASTCSPAITTGGERESEMGVHHHLYRPLRVRAAQRQLDSYVPVGSQLGVFT
ncbi:MAG: phage tail protein [Jiangellales bacterium]